MQENDKNKFLKNKKTSKSSIQLLTISKYNTKNIMNEHKS